MFFCVVLEPFGKIFFWNYYFCLKIKLNSDISHRLDSDSKIEGSIKKDSILVVDRSVNPTHNKIVVAVINNSFVLKRLRIKNGIKFLIDEDSFIEKSPSILNENSYIWGVVTSFITKV